MATSGMSYAVHYDLSQDNGGLLQDFSRMRLETAREPPVLYVAMATWIPKCNMYNDHNCEPQSPVQKQPSNGETSTIENGQVKDCVGSFSDNKEMKTNIDDELDLTDSVNNETLEGEETEDNMKKPIKQIEEKLTITPKKASSPKQIQKKLESEKKRQQKQLEREEREKKKQEEKERVKQEKIKKQQEKEEIRKKKEKERELKEEQKRKEREEKEAKRKEKEEREEAKRKEREQEKMRKLQEIEEKNKEKQKLEEQKQKAAQAFVNFFVPKKSEVKTEETKDQMFMPFEVKSDMRLASIRRRRLTEEERNTLEEAISKNNEEKTYLVLLREGKKFGQCDKTWPQEDVDDVVIIEEDFGESICEDKPKMQKMRVKFLKFHENRRPPYYGTWRKKSSFVKSRRPFAEDKVFFDYEVDSDDDWEEEEQGESLENGSDDEDKENEIENEDYEVDNEFFVPHGHLSDDEVDDEESSKLSPESHKQKLKLLKDEFDQDMQAKTNKLKPRSIGCIWYDKDGSNVDEAIDRHLRPLAMITNGQIILKKRKNPILNTPVRKYAKELCQELIPAFLKHINKNSNKKSVVVEEFISNMQNNGSCVEVSKAHLKKRLNEFAQWKKCLHEGPMFNKYCWIVEDDVIKKFNIE